MKLLEREPDCCQEKLLARYIVCGTGAGLEMSMNERMDTCPCGSNRKLVDCCGLYMSGSVHAQTAEALMRSRYVAYVLLREEYLLATWHSSTRPGKLGLDEEASVKWLGLEVKRSEQQDEDHAVVEFVARYKVNGRAFRLHETSRFVREAGQWRYLDGDIA